MRKIVMVVIKESKTLLYMSIKRNKYIIVNMLICIFLLIFIQVCLKVGFFLQFFGGAWGSTCFPWPTFRSQKKACRD